MRVYNVQHTVLSLFCYQKKKKNSPSFVFAKHSNEKKERKKGSVCVVCWDFFSFFSLYSQFLQSPSSQPREAASTETYMCSYLFTYTLMIISESYIRRSHTMEHMNIALKEEKQVEELFEHGFGNFGRFSFENDE